MSSLLELAALRSSNWDTILPKIVQVDSEILGCERVGFWSLSELRAAIRCECNYTSSSSTFERGLMLFEVAHPRYFAEIRRERILIVDDVWKDERLRTLADYFRARAITRLMDVPVWTDGHLAGVLCHEQTAEARAWTTAEEEFAIAVAQIVATAIEARARDCAEKAERRAHFLADVTGALSSTLDVSEAARRAVRIALPTLGDLSALDLLDGDVVRREAIAAIAPDAEAKAMEHARRFPPTLDGPHIAVRAIRLREAIIVPDIDAETLAAFGFEGEHLDFARSIGMRSVIAIPLVAQERVLGDMTFWARHRRFSLEDLRLAEEFGYRVAVVLANAQLYARAEEAIRARDEFVAIAAHELRTPLTSLVLAGDVLAHQLAAGEPEPLARANDTIRRQTRRLHELIERMLDVSRSRSGGLTVQCAAIDLAELVRDVARTFAPALERAGSRLDLHVPPSLPGRWDGQRLEQVVGNLLDNAIKFGKGRPIDVSLGGADGRVVLTVRDRGVGIPADRLPFVFDRFERAVSTRQFGGLGLGLYVVRAVVEAHGGTISVDSRVEEGTTFVVELPLASADA